MCKHCKGKLNQPTAETLKQIQVIRDFPNTSNHRTRIIIPESAEVWVSRDDSPQIYMSIARQKVWFKWLGTGAWELLEKAPDCVQAATEAVPKSFVAGIYYDSADKKLYARDSEGRWKIFDSEEHPQEWEPILAGDGIFELVKNLSRIG